ncbi:hypothetical protein L1987_10429 [Smallanthus sonchifolius]|uniref:Uncharacterized protein n=1 Tax=Smallanthus sonchifolius TaxID=185202 RepID=A0ACB9JS64_9ASTR|nr:hypothetical protein L1987_10429 [Smallanthus sonchifolius]
MRRTTCRLRGFFFATYFVVYALNTGRDCDGFVIEVDVVVTAIEVVISVSPFVKLPRYSHVPRHGPNYYTGPFLRGTCSELFIIYLYFKWEELCSVRLVKLDMTRKLWEEMEDFDDAACFLYLDCSSTAIASKSGGGYIHMLCEEDKVMYSYHVKDKTLAVSSMPHCQDLPPPPRSRTSYVSVWAMPECRLEGDIKEEEDDTVEVEVNGMMNQHHESHLFNIPFHVLEMIMEFCDDTDYVNFRATCKQLTAPVTRWSNGASMRRLQRYSLVSPWLMVLDKGHGIITFTDPMFSDQLPNLEVLFLESFCFSAPPSSPDCMVVGFGGPCVFIHFVAHKPATWLRYDLEFVGDAPSENFSYSTSCGRDLYALNKVGRLSVFTEICEKNHSWVDVDIAPTSCCRSLAQYFLVKRDQDLLLVILDEFGESVELFKLNRHAKKWEKMHGLGKHMIYICDTTCLCMEARTPEMESKIYFAVLHSENGKIVFYSLDTCRYHTFSGKSIVERLRDFFGTKQLLHPHVWIEPSYS